MNGGALSTALYTKNGRLRRDLHKPAIGDHRPPAGASPFDDAPIGHDPGLAAEADAERQRERHQLAETERLADAANERAARKRQEQAGRQRPHGEREVIGQFAAKPNAIDRDRRDAENAQRRDARRHPDRAATSVIYANWRDDPKWASVLQREPAAKWKAVR